MSITIEAPHEQFKLEPREAIEAIIPLDQSTTLVEVAIDAIKDATNKRLKAKDPNAGEPEADEADPDWTPGKRQPKNLGGPIKKARRKKKIKKISNLNARCQRKAQDVIEPETIKEFM